VNKHFRVRPGSADWEFNSLACARAGRDGRESRSEHVQAQCRDEPDETVRLHEKPPSNPSPGMSWAQIQKSAGGVAKTGRNPVGGRIYPVDIWSISGRRLASPGLGTTGWAATRPGKRRRSRCVILLLGDIGAFGVVVAIQGAEKATGGIAWTPQPGCKNVSEHMALGIFPYCTYAPRNGAVWAMRPT
jgi:hypothetical protein